MKVSKYELCSSCLGIRQPMNNGGLSDSIGEVLDSKGYNMPNGDTIGNQMILFRLEQFGGCPSCINVLKRAT